MSIEQKPTSQATGTAPVSAIENELPTYRAISPVAVVSLVCGVLSLLSFAHWVFLLVAAAAIALGIFADRKIQRFSDILTGRGIAQAGIALGLTFGLASVTTTAVQGWIRVREATRFARLYEKVIEDGTIEDAAWYGQAPFRREGKTPKGLYEEMMTSKLGPGMTDPELEKLQQFKQVVDGEGVDLHFMKIETHGTDKVSPFAAALFEVHQPEGKGPHEGETFALLVMKGVKANGKFDWWIESLVYPYKPASYTPSIAKADDGHGHAH